MSLNPPLEILPSIFPIVLHRALETNIVALLARSIALSILCYLPTLYPVRHRSSLKELYLLEHLNTKSTKDQFTLDFPAVKRQMSSPITHQGVISIKIVSLEASCFEYQSFPGDILLSIICVAIFSASLFLCKCKFYKRIFKRNVTENHISSRTWYLSKSPLRLMVFM